MHIYTSDIIKKWDQFTLDEERISSAMLMHRAATALFHRIIEIFPDIKQSFHVICGTGNNGGDGLVIADLLYAKGYSVEVFVYPLSHKQSNDFTHFYKNILRSGNIKIETLSREKIALKANKTVAIDAIIGAGLTRPPDQDLYDVIDLINRNYTKIISIDVPTGISSDTIIGTNSINADITLSVQSPKLSFMFEEVSSRTGQLHIIDIGLSSTFERITPPYAIYIDNHLTFAKLRKRNKNEYKNSFGSAGLLCGSLEMQGAAILAARSCMRAGTGLLYCHLPGVMKSVLTQSLPEAITYLDICEEYITKIEIGRQLDAVGIGCGLGTRHLTQQAIIEFIKSNTCKNLVVDADALNAIAAHDALHLLPRNSILTPHPGEFKRLFGTYTNSEDRLKIQIENSIKYGIYIICKSHHTAITTPEGKIYFNSTGNPGMATAGSGDVLTGLLTGLLAQGYSAEDASVLGVYLHGLAGDLAADEFGENAMIASDIINKIPQAYQYISHHNSNEI